ncbi:MAG: TIGR03000 domain-containing protein [Planctomycetia bacterium]|nr:TIGR03000 domain-containing protein [Planctomycetia bacterium]
MKRLLIAFAVFAGVVLGSAREANAFHGQVVGPPSTSVTWPCVTPPGWYTNTYLHAWYYPWYAYYNFSHGPYANWMVGGGYATYAHCGPGGHFHWHDRVPAQPWTGGPVHPFQAPPMMAPPKKPNDEPKKENVSAGVVAVVLPTDARLLFNGTEATGSGSVRTFRTPPLQPGQNYKYELTAEVIRDGRPERLTASVIVRAGETSQVTLMPELATASK